MGKASAGAPPASSQETTDQILKSYAANIPSVLNATASQSVPLAQADLKAAQAVAGGYNDLTSQNTKFAADLLAGSGGDVARAAKALDESVNPEYAAIKAKAAGKTSELLDSVSLSGLSGGERAEVERSLAKSNVATGNLGLDNATNAVKNAMSFGDRMAQKRAELGNIIAGATGFLGTKDQTFNPVSTALTQGNTIMPSSNNAFSFGQSALGNVAQATGAQNALTSDYNWKNSTRYALSDIGANA